MKQYGKLISSFFSMSFILSLFCPSLSLAQCLAPPIWPPMAIFPLPTCIPSKHLKDGVYVGLGMGADSYRIRQKLSFIETRGVIAIFNPALEVGGLLGSTFLGYGQYYCRFYIAGEVFADFSATNTSYEKRSRNSFYNVTLNVRSSYGGDILAGYKLNPFTLLYGRLGYVRTTFKSTESLINSAIGLNNQHLSQTAYGNGIHYGVGIESAIFHYFYDCCGRPCCNHFANNFSLRAEYTYTTYNSWKTQVNTTFTPSNNQFVMSLIYHFA